MEPSISSSSFRCTLDLPLQRRTGKKAYPTGRTGAIAARQLDGLPASRLDVTRLLSTRPQGLATGCTLRTLSRWDLAPVLALPHLHQLLEQLGPHLVHVLIDCRFDLGPRRVRVVFPPLGHPQQVSQSCADLLYLFDSVAVCSSWLSCSCSSPSHEMRNELGRADRRARLAGEKRNGRWSVKNRACFLEERGQGSSKDVSEAEKVKKKQVGVEKRAG